MKTCKKILCFLLSLICVFSLVACKKDEVIKVKNGTVDLGLRETYNGTHIYTATNTNDYLVTDGRTEYKLVVPSVTNEILQRAQDEFVTLFRLATGIKINVILDTNLTHDANNKYISLGETTISNASDVQTKKQTLTRDGGRIVTVDKSIFIYGGSDYGTLFAVYTFMSITFNYECYFADCIEIDTNVKQKELKNYDVTDIPDFKHRGVNNTLLRELDGVAISDYGYRMRYVAGRAFDFIPIHKTYDGANDGRSSTNSLTYLPPEIYQEEHPDWYSSGGSELCFTAHGDRIEGEFEAMLQECTNKITYSLMRYTPQEYPLYNAASITQQDNLDYCGCKGEGGCEELSRKYGGIVGVYIWFCNQLAERVQQWMNNPENVAYARENFRIFFFGYSYTVEAPVKYDPISDKYVPYHEDIVLRDDVGVYLAMTNFDYQYSFWDDRNKVGRENVEKWTALTDNVYYWLYSCNFRNMMFPFESFNFFYDGAMAWLANRSNEHFFSQTQEPTKGTMTAWNNLKHYLDAKLSWDTSLNVEELTQNFFDAMYGQASDEMMEIFYSHRAYMNNVILGVHGLSGNGDARPALEKPEYWSFLQLQKWIDDIDAAKKSIEHVKELDYETYDLNCKHIEAEVISNIYLTFICHRTSLTSAKKKEYKDRLLYDIEWMGLSNMSIGHSSGNLLADWVYAIEV